MYLSVDIDRGVSTVRNILKTMVIKLHQFTAFLLIGSHNYKKKRALEKDSTKSLRHTRNLLEKT